MKVATYEAVVENGQIKLLDAPSLPENARVYVVVTGVEDVRPFRAGGPRLARPEQASDFVKEVTPESRDALLLMTAIFPLQHRSPGSSFVIPINP